MDQVERFGPAEVGMLAIDDPSGAPLFPRVADAMMSISSAEPPAGARLPASWERIAR